MVSKELTIQTGPNFSSFKQRLSLPSVARETKQSGKTKLDHYFWNSIDAKTNCSFFQKIGKSVIQNR